MYSLDITNRIICTRFGLMKQMDKWDTSGEKTVSKNMFLLCIEGSFCFTVDGKKYPLTPGTVFFLPANTPYLISTDDFCSYYYCHFHGRMLPCPLVRKPDISTPNLDDDLLLFAENQIYLPSHFDISSIFNRTHQRLINCTEYKTKGTHLGQELLNTEFYKILLTVAELYQQMQSSETQYSSAVNRVITYIRKNLTRPLKMMDICNDCNISPSYLERIFKKHTQMTVTEYIHSEKMYFACRLMQSSHLTISQIASYLGYNDISYFSRRFKRQFGKSPSHMFPK